MDGGICGRRLKFLLILVVRKLKKIWKKVWTQPWCIKTWDLNLNCYLKDYRLWPLQVKETKILLNTYILNSFFLLLVCLITSLRFSQNFWLKNSIKSQKIAYSSAELLKKIIAQSIIVMYKKFHNEAIFSIPFNNQLKLKCHNSCNLLPIYPSLSVYIW